MKRITLTLAFVAAVCGSAFAQSNKEDIAIIQDMLGKGKKELVSDLVKVAPESADKFWKLYDEYEVKRKALGADKIKLIEQYANQYKSLTDDQASSLMNSNLANNISMDKLQKTYFKKFSKVIGGTQAAQLMQVENYIKNAIQMKVQNEIPFINDLIRK